MNNNEVDHIKLMVEKIHETNNENMEEHAYETMVHWAQRHNMVSKFNIQIMLVPIIKHVVVEHVPIIYMIKNNESRLMRNSKSKILLGEQVCHKRTCNVDKIPRFDLAQCNYYHKKRHLINDHLFIEDFVK